MIKMATSPAPSAQLQTALVVGGGIGGMATAVLLAKRGIFVDLIDLDPAWKVSGAGITITGPTLRGYQRLGMLDDIKAHGAVTAKTSIFHFSGQWVRDLDELPLEEGVPAHGGIMRPVLHQLMQERVHAAKIPVRLGITVTALTPKPGGVDVMFNDGSNGTYDLVVGADSIFSGVRALA
ncbi:MAG: FAD-dependent monooxygenase, partial [Alphaproteobacteria bacterium]|nr:FAD-dependent monooxygenase [Alphaproteobacteria bacterium]